jgi:hypothetical protein
MVGPEGRLPSVRADVMRQRFSMDAFPRAISQLRDDFVAASSDL